MADSTGRRIEWCEFAGDLLCFCEWHDNEPETKCPDLGDWSDTPHDQLDKTIHPWDQMVIDARIRLDRERLLSYIED